MKAAAWNWNYLHAGEVCVTYVTATATPLYVDAMRMSGIILPWILL